MPNDAFGVRIFGQQSGLQNWFHRFTEGEENGTKNRSIFTKQPNFTCESGLSQPYGESSNRPTMLSACHLGSIENIL
jgi:hypothetical protein